MAEGKKHSTLLQEERSQSGVLFDKDAQRPKLDAGGREGVFSTMLRSEERNLDDASGKRAHGRRKTGHSRTMDRSREALDENDGRAKDSQQEMADETLATSAALEKLAKSRRAKSENASKASAAESAGAEKAAEAQRKPSRMLSAGDGEAAGKNAGKATSSKGTGNKKSAAAKAKRAKGKELMRERFKAGSGRVARERAIAGVEQVAQTQKSSVRRAASKVGQVLKSLLSGLLAGMSGAMGPLVIGALTLILAVVIGSLIGGAVANSSAGGDGGSKLASWAIKEYEEGAARGDYHINGKRYDGKEPYWSSVGYEVAWCSLFVYTGWTECGFDQLLGSPDNPAWAASWLPFCDDSSVGRVIEYDSSYVPKPGDIIVNGARNASTSGHVGIVVSGITDDGTFRVIHGNWGEKVGSENYFPGQGGTSTDQWKYVARPNYPASGRGEIEIPETYDGVDVGYYGTWEWDLSKNSFGWVPGQIQAIWREKGSVTDGLFCMLDGKYLIACTETFGDVGDWITFYFSDGSSIECVMIDTKSSGDSNWTPWGHNSDGGINVLEFPFVGDYHGHAVYDELGKSGLRVVGATNHGSYI